MPCRVFVLFSPTLLLSADLELRAQKAAERDALRDALQQMQCLWAAQDAAEERARDEALAHEQMKVLTCIAPNSDNTMKTSWKRSFTQQTNENQEEKYETTVFDKTT